VTFGWDIGGSGTNDSVDTRSLCAGGREMGRWTFGKMAYVVEETSVKKIGCFVEEGDDRIGFKRLGLGRKNQGASGITQKRL
jgi:hypothetical protein